MSNPEDNYVIRKTKDIAQACYYIKNGSGDPLWHNQSALSSSLPFLLIQLTVILIVDRLLLIILKPLRQPPIVSRVLCGILLGPTLVGKSPLTEKYFIPHKTGMVLETFANLGLTYYMFLVGLEMDVSLIMQSGVQVISVTIVGVVFPLILGFGMYFATLKDSDQIDRRGSIFWAIALTSTNFPDLARILADVKLLRTSIGRLAMSSAILTDLFSWLLLIIALSVFNGQKYISVLSTIGFVLICVFALRPVLAWVFDHTSKGEIISDTHVWFIMAGVLLFGLATDVCGSHSIVGAFMFGAILPQEDYVKNKVIEKLNDFVSGILMPLFFMTNGMRTDLRFLFGETPWTMVLLVIALSWAAKVVSVFFVSLHFKMSILDSLILGMLMNTKGVLALIVLNSGRNIQALNNQTFPVMVLALLAMSCLITPIIVFANRPKRKLVRQMNRSIKGSKPDMELRVLACVHSMRNVTGMLSLLNLSHGTKDSPLSIFAIHLTELSQRASTAMLIVHDDRGGSDSSQDVFRFNRAAKTETANIIRTCENFEKLYNAVTVQTISVMSPYATMHIDICSLAEDKRVNLIVIPFHKEAKPDGTMGNVNTNIAHVNKNVLMNAPCSVGILLDRGIGSKLFETQDRLSGTFTTKQIVMLFIGGPDDREALACANRMAGHQCVSLTVARFLPVEDETELNQQSASVNRERQVDDEHLEEFKFKSIGYNDIKFTEMFVHNGEETIGAIRGLGDNVFDLFVIGRRQGEARSRVIEGLAEWGSYPEMGTMGDTLVSSSFALNASILVVQHYVSTDVIHEISDN